MVDKPEVWGMRRWRAAGGSNESTAVVTKNVGNVSRVAIVANPQSVNESQQEGMLEITVGNVVR